MNSSCQDQDRDITESDELPNPLERIVVGQASGLSRLLGYDPAGSLRGRAEPLIDLDPAGVACGYIDVFIPPDHTPPHLTQPEGGFSLSLSAPMDPVRAESATRQDLRFLRDRLHYLGPPLSNSRRSPSHTSALLRLTDPSGIRDDLSNLPDYRSAGVSSIAMAWCRPSRFACGVSYRRPAVPERGTGLTALGRELVHACEVEGIILDLAHLTLAGVADVAAVASSPLVISHAAVHDLTPSSRALVAEHWAAVEASRGVVGIAPEPGTGDPVIQNADHIERALSLASEDTVALGSDLVEATEGWGRCRAREVIVELQRRGLPNETLHKIASANWDRIHRSSERENTR